MDKDVIDAEYRVVGEVRTKRRHKEQEAWSEEHYREWLARPWWDKYELTLNPVSLIAAALVVAALVARGWG